MSCMGEVVERRRRRYACAFHWYYGGGKIRSHFIFIPGWGRWMILLCISSLSHKSLVFSFWYVLLHCERNRCAVAICEFVGVFDCCTTSMMLKFETTSMCAILFFFLSQLCRKVIFLLSRHVPSLSRSAVVCVCVVSVSMRDGVEGCWSIPSAAYVLPPNFSLSDSTTCVLCDRH